MFEKLLGGKSGPLFRALRGTEWSQFADYVSPAFLEVVPLRSLVSQARHMLANARDEAGFETLRGDVAKRLALRNVALEVGSSAGDASPVTGGLLPESVRRGVGQRALEVYFAQIFTADAAILDLRAARFAVPGDARDEDSAAVWFPRPFWIRWDPDFLEALRELYAGFYSGDERCTARGLEALHLEPAGDVLRRHFGAGDQRRVRFSSRDFHATFHDAFVRCRDGGATLHPDFLALGVYLACLYDLLEALDLPFDVRDAYERGTRP